MPTNPTEPTAVYPLHDLIRAPYYREQAVQYANYWAYRRNPNYYSFDQLGGDCTNFVSQAIYYAAGVMNYTPTYGWYYISLNNRSPCLLYTSIHTVIGSFGLVTVAPFTALCSGILFTAKKRR